MKLVEPIGRKPVSTILDNLEVAYASFDLKLASRGYPGPKRRENKPGLVMNHGLIVQQNNITPDIFAESARPLRYFRIVVLVVARNPIG
jgi:hypothetical protein